MPRTHALDLPEILSLIGSFIPIWENKYSHLQILGSRHYRPVLLCRCLRVSKFWYDTLLPILWYGYWTDNKTMVDMIPSEAIALHCHLLKTLRMNEYGIPFIKPLLLRGCTSLVELDIQISIKRPKSQRNDEPVGLPEQQLLRSNPLLKTLRWTGEYKPGTALEPEDFVGLKCLETLTLQYWRCEDGQLARTLKVVSGTLKRLTIGWMHGVQPEDFPPPVALLQEGEKGRHGKNTGPDHTGEDLDVVGLRLDRLEWLSWYCGRTRVESFTELIKCCPNLKSLKLANDIAWNLDGVTEGLRLHCPSLESLEIPYCLRSPPLKTFIHRCSTTGLRILHIASRKSEEDIIPGALHHALTLEDLRIEPYMDNMDALTFLPLLAGCTKLKRFALHSSFKYFAKTQNPLEALKEEKWRCRGLQELDLKFAFIESYDTITEENELEFRRMMLEARWEMVPFSYRHYQFDLTHLPKVIALLEFQELEELQRLVLDDIPFRKSRYRS
ncbi:MAG: hypothetical protein J3R72DRAFT_435404 [Linnemannia gamsii]|nr:MAG: hypothetical protein J3R72DRAFT_435404 [Linnemannia gamsii]